MINKYLLTKYVRGGRGPHEYDCWGIVRTARAELFDKDTLPSYSNICPSDKKLLTEAYNQVRIDRQFYPCSHIEGAIATAWQGKLCVHVGLVINADGRVWVLETDEASGPCLTNIEQFEARYTRVIYYDD